MSNLSVVVYSCTRNFTSIELLEFTVLTSDNNRKYISHSIRFFLSNTSARPAVAGMSTSKARIESVEKAFHNLFSSGTSLAKIKDASLADRLFPFSDDVLEVPGRSIAWKLFLVQSEPLKALIEADSSPLLDSLRETRRQYAALLLEKMRAPDGSYEDGFALPGSLPSPKRESRLEVNLDRNNPLSLHTENPWTEWFASVELRKTILQDVERTFPEIDFFRLPDVQAQLTNILFIYSVMHPTIGYRQGMHELLAPLYYAVEYDSISEDDQEYVHDFKVHEMCSKPWVAADAWCLFDAVMQSTSRWYEWQEPPVDAKGRSPLPSHVLLHIPEGAVDLKPYVPPIVQTCNNIQANFLRTTDPHLWQRLQTTGIEPQIYGIRWLRLLFTREFSLPDAMKLWDALFACDPSFDLAPWICVAMLIRIRNELLPSDYSTQLTVLLRYPSVLRSFEYGSPVHPTSLLVRQALALQMSPTPSTGVLLVSENRNLLNIAIDVPETPPAPRRRSTRNRPLSTSVASGNGNVAQGHVRQQSSQNLGFPEMLARGILERGESLGINKTLMSAVSELKRNIPEIASSLMRAPANAYQMTDENIGERPPGEHRSRLEMEKELSELHMVNKKLGDSLGWIVDVLLQDEDQTNAERLKKQRRQAIESLSYVRDILISQSTDIEEERLYSEEQIANRRQEKTKQADAVEVLQPKIPTPVKPNPARGKGSRPLPVASMPPAGPMSSSLSQNTNPARLAPWNYTRSNFSSTSSLPETLLPRPPPPTSTTIPRSALDGRRDKASEVLQDPLGALH
ncbi:RabGAP/TBC [Desarmillaria tabescens]|uniref:RabGAP/TBC n=1 Tax=Armillaria tabescens TaxID=1929756 RepID=A0AA39KES4_ARMTA|nr:RabGAP/TBC [Desarmillaria tabescens]KAK0459657.1 RabGAP/TBC [Desarmillaria tabescens]